MLFEGQVVIVSGIGPGLGQGLAVLAAQEGANVVLSARTPEKLEAAEREIRDLGLGVGVLRQPTDIRDAAQCEALAAASLARFGRIDGLINSAFASATGPRIEDSNLDDWRGVMDTNFFGSLNMSRAVFPAMKAQGKGSIVNINTMATRKPMPGRGAYTASKAALASVTRLMAQEWGEFGIRVNTVTMGWMWSAGLEAAMHRQADAAGITYDQHKGQVTAGIPLGHIPPDRECARSALAILSDQCSQVTGANLDVNGGEFMAL